MELDQRLNLVSSLKEQYDQYNFELKKINSLLENFKNLDKIGSIIPVIESNLIKRNTYESYIARLNRTKAEVFSISNTLDNLKNIDSIYEKAKDIEIKEKTLDLYSKLLKEYKANYNLINETKKDLDSIKNISKISDINNSLDKKINLYTKIFSTKENLLAINDKLNYGNNYIKNFSNNDAIGNISEKLENKIRSLFVLSDFQRKLAELNNHYRIEANDLDEIKSNLNSYTESYEKTILEIGVCPFCYSEINNDSIEHIKYHLRND